MATSALPVGRREWDVLRRRIRDEVSAILGARYPDLRLTAIDQDARRASLAWSDRVVPHWDWHSITKRRPHNRLDIAIWHDDRLCGLAYGPATAEYVAIERLEGDPDPRHPLKGRVIDIAVDYLEAHAFVIQASEMRLIDPFPALRTHYAERGFGDLIAIPGETPYLRKRRSG